MAAMFGDVWVKAGDGVGFTIPSREPNKRIDFLWLRHGAPLRPIRAWVPRSEASDHLPLVAEFAWADAPGAGRPSYLNSLGVNSRR